MNIKDTNSDNYSRRSVLGTVGTAVVASNGTRLGINGNDPGRDQVSGDWEMEGYDSGGTNYVPANNAPKQDKVQQLLEINISETRLQAPIVIGKRAFLSSDGPSPKMYAVNIESGKVLWKRNLGGVSDTSPVSHNSRVYTGVAATTKKNNRGVRRFDTKAGQNETISLNRFGYISAKRFDGDIYYGTTGGDLIRTTSEPFRVAWEQSDFPKQSDVTSIAVSMNSVFVAIKKRQFRTEDRTGRPGKEGALYVVSTDKGEKKWTRDYATPVKGVSASNGRVLVATERRVELLDIKRAEPVWSNTATGTSGGLALTEDLAIVGGNGQLQTFDLATGSRKWTADFHMGYPRPVVGGSSVYTTVDGIAGDKIETDSGEVQTAPKGRLEIVNYNSGEILQEFEFESNRISAPVVAQGSVFISDFSGKIHRFE